MLTYCCTYLPTPGIRAVKMGYPAHFGLAYSGFGLRQIGLKSPLKIWAVKIVFKPGPVWASQFYFIF
jgi:hypothetical protein